MELDMEQGIQLIRKAKEEEDRRLLWEEWLMLRPHMTEGNVLSFDKFYESRAQPITLKRKSKAQLLQEAEERRKKLQRG